MANPRYVVAFGVALCLLLASGGAFEIYDENPAAFEQDWLYQDDSYGDTGPLADSRAEDPVRDLMLFKLLKNMRANDLTYAKPFYRPKYVLDDRSLPNGDLMKEPEKRLTHVLTNVANLHKVAKPAVVPQQKWKTKKGKTVGSQMICYFKLCAFRAP